MVGDTAQILANQMLNTNMQDSYTEAHFQLSCSCDKNRREKKSFKQKGQIQRLKRVKCQKVENQLKFLSNIKNFSLEELGLNWRPGLPLVFVSHCGADAAWDSTEERHVHPEGALRSTCTVASTLQGGPLMQTPCYFPGLYK